MISFNLAFLVEIRRLQKKNDSCIKSFFYFKDGLRFISILWGNLVTKEFCLWSLFTVNNSRNSITELNARLGAIKADILISSFFVKFL